MDCATRSTPGSTANLLLLVPIEIAGQTIKLYNMARKTNEHKQPIQNLKSKTKQEAYG